MEVFRAFGPAWDTFESGLGDRGSIAGICSREAMTASPASTYYPSLSFSYLSRDRVPAKSPIRVGVRWGKQVGGYARYDPSALTSHAPNPVSTAFDNLIGELGRGQGCVKVPEV